MDDNEDPTGLTSPIDPDEELNLMTAKVKEHFQEQNRVPLTAENFRAMAEFCNTMTSSMLTVFTALQEQFKQGALAFTQMAELLERDAKSTEKRTKVENIFEKEEPTDPGPIVSND